MNWRLLVLVAVAIASAGCNAEPGDPAEPPSRGAQASSSPPPPPPPPPSPLPAPPSSPASPDSAADSLPDSAADSLPDEEPDASRAEVSTDQSKESGAYVSFSAAGVKLIRPEGFDDAGGSSGFEQSSTQSSVIVDSIPVPFSEIAGGFTAERLRGGAIALLGSEDIEIDGLSGKLIHLRQKALGTDVVKWIVVLDDKGETKMITAVFPKSAEAALSETLKAAVLSTRLDDAPAPPPGADIGN